MSYAIKIPKSILKDFKIDRESSTEEVLVLKTAAITNDQEAYAFVRKFENLIGTKYILNFTNPNPTRIFYHTRWVCKYSKCNKSQDSKTNLNCGAYISYKIPKYYFLTKSRDAYGVLRKRHKPGILKISLKHTHPLEVSRKNTLRNADYMLWPKEIAKESDVSTDGDIEHVGSKDGTNKRKRDLLTKEQEENDPENPQEEEEDTDSSNSPPEKKKPLNPKTKFGRPRKYQRSKKKRKVNLWEYKKEKEASRNSPVDSCLEKQTNTSDSLSECSNQSIKLDTSTIKIEKDTFTNSDCPTTSEKENQSISPSKCPIEVKKVKLSNLPTCDPDVCEKERETIILSDNSAASVNDTKNSMTSDKPIVNKNDAQIIVPSNNSIVSSPEKHTVLHSNDQAASKSEKQVIRPVTSPNENQITITTSNVLETQTKEQTITSSNHFQPVIESATSTQNKHFPQVVFLQVKPNFPLLQPGVQLKDFTLLPGRIPPSISSGTKTLTSKVQSLRNTPTLSGQIIRNGTNSNPILFIRPLDSSANLPNPTTISIPPKTNSSTSTNFSQPMEQTKQSSTIPTTEAKLPNSMQNLYIKEEPIDIVEDAYELSDAAMKNYFIPTNQIENSAFDQPLKAAKCDIGEEINRCYNYAGKLFKRLKSERLSMEDNSSLTANPSPKISPNQSDKRKKRKTEPDEFDSDRKQKEDEIDSYCKQVAKRLKTMNSETIAFVQKAIDNLLCDAEVGLGEFLEEKKDGERSLRGCVTPTYMTVSDESASPFSLGETSPSGDSESTLTALSDSNVSS